MWHGIARRAALVDTNAPRSPLACSDAGDADAPQADDGRMPFWHTVEFVQQPGHVTSTSSRVVPMKRTQRAAGAAGHVWTHLACTTAGSRIRRRMPLSTASTAICHHRATTELFCSAAHSHCRRWTESCIEEGIISESVTPAVHARCE